MAQHRYRLLEEGVASGFNAFNGLEAGDELDHDFYDQNSGLNHEQAVIAAGWVERLDQDEKPRGGKK